MLHSRSATSCSALRSSPSFFPKHPLTAPLHLIFESLCSIFHSAHSPLTDAYFSTGAELSEHLGTSLMVPKCIGSKVFVHLIFKLHNILLFCISKIILCDFAKNTTVITKNISNTKIQQYLHWPNCTNDGKLFAMRLLSRSHVNDIFLIFHSYVFCTTCQV